MICLVTKLKKIFNFAIKESEKAPIYITRNKTKQRWHGC